MNEISSEPHGVQRCGIFSELPALLRSYGIDPVPLLKHRGFDPYAFDDPEKALPFAEVVRVIDDCARATDVGVFGLILGLRARTAHLGVIGEMVRNAPTFGRAVRGVVENHHRYVRGGAPYLIEQDPYVVHHRHEVLVGYRCLISGLPALQFLLVSIGAGIAVLRELSGHVPKEVLIGCSSEELPADEIRALLKPSLVTFEAHHFGLTYPKNIISAPIKGADPSKFQAALKRVNDYWNGLEPDFKDQVCRLLLPVLHAERAHMRMLSEMTGLHPRTINRRLAEQGTTLRALVNETRYSIARQLLRHTHLPVTAVAQVMGYSEPGVFVRAFRHWSGSTPDNWRKTLPRQPDESAPPAISL